MNIPGQKEIIDILFEEYPYGLLLVSSVDGQIIRSNTVFDNMPVAGKTTLTGRSIADFLFDKDDDKYAAVKNCEEISGKSIFIKTSSDPPNYIPLKYKLRTGKYKGQKVYLFFSEPLSSGSDDNFVLQLASIVESSQDAIISIDLQGKVISWNKAAEKVYGYSAHEIIGNSIMRIYPDNKKVELGIILNKIGRGETIENFETERVNKKGKKNNISVTISPVKDKTGRIYGASSIERDITNKIAVEKERISREKQLIETQQIAHLGYWELEVKTGKVHWSDELYKIYGLDKSEFVPTEENFIEKIHPEERQSVKNILEKALHDHRPFELNHKIILPGGQTKNIYGRCEVVLDESYNPVKLRGIAQDITEQKRLERRMEAQFEVTKILAESSRLADTAPGILKTLCEGIDWQIGEMWLVDQDSNLLELKSSWSAASLEADEFIEISNKCKFGKGVSIQGRTWEKGQPIWTNHMIDDQFFPRAGLATSLNLHTSLCFPIYGKEKITGVIAFYKVDISEPDTELLKMLEAMGHQIGDYIEKKRSEPALKESEGLYQTLVETSPDAITYTDLSGKIVFCNQQAAELFGYRLVEDIIGQNVYAFIAPEDQHNAVENEHNTIVNGKTKNVEYTLQKKDGTKFPAEINTSIVFDVEKEPKAFIGVMRDISERKKNELEIKVRAEQQAIIAEIGQSALQGMDISELTQKSSELVAKILNIEYSGVWETNENSDNMLLKSGYGWETGIVGNVSIKAGMETLAGSLLKSNQPVIVNNIQTEKRFLISDFIINHKILSGIAVVIPGTNKPYGVLGGYSKNFRLFSQNDALYLKATANIIGTAIDRKHIENELENTLIGVKEAKEELEFSKKRLEYLAEASKILNSSLDYKKTLGSVAELIIKELADWCVIDILNENNKLKRVVIAHSDPSKKENIKRFEQEYIPSSKSNLGIHKVINTGEPLLLHNVDELLLKRIAVTDKNYSLLKELGFKSAIVVPLKARNQLIGALSLVSSKENRLYDDTDLIFAQDLAFHASGAIDNSRLFEETRNMNERLEQKVKERTSELKISNSELEIEVKMRLKVAEELKMRVQQQSAIAELGQIALRNSSFSDLLHTAVYSVAKILDMEYCGILEVLRSKDSVRFLAQTGWEKNVSEVDIFIENENPYFNEIKNTEETLIKENFSERNECDLPLFIRDYGIKNGMSINITEGNSLFGILCAYSAKERRYSVYDSLFLKSIANVLTIAMDRKNAEEKTNGLLDAVPDAVIILNSEGRIIMANNQTEILFGYKKEEMLFKEIEILVPVRFRNRHVADRKKYFENPWRRPMNSKLELYGRKKDGTDFPADISLNPFNTRHESLVSVAVRDISQIRKNENMAYRKSRIFNHIRNAIVSTDLKGRIESWNAGAERIYGYKAGEVLGKNISLLYGIEQEEYVQKRIIKPLVENGYLDTIMNLKRKNNEEMFAFLSLSLLNNKSGRITGMVGCSVDISELKNEAMIFDNFIENTPESFIISDIKGKILNVNENAANLFGYERKALVGRNIDPMFSNGLMDVINKIINDDLLNFKAANDPGEKIYSAFDINNLEFKVLAGLNSLETPKGKVIVISVKKDE